MAVWSFFLEIYYLIFAIWKEMQGYWLRAFFSRMVSIGTLTPRHYDKSVITLYSF